MRNPTKPNNMDDNNLLSYDNNGGLHRTGFSPIIRSPQLGWFG